MLHQTIVPIETQYGNLYGRDTIFLDETHLQHSPSILVLKGTINQSDSQSETAYTLTFQQVMALLIIELDSWQNVAPEIWYENPTCLGEFKNSDWIIALGGKVNLNQQHHFLVVTYDDVYQIVCESMTLVLGAKAD